MKKIILSLAVLALVGGGVFGVTRAYFSDAETITGNSFTSGTLDLKIDNDPSSSAYNWVDGFDSSMSFVNLYPGFSDEQIIDIANFGTIDGNATIKFNKSGSGALADKLHFTVYFDGDHDGNFETTVATGPLSAWDGNTYPMGLMEGGSDGTAAKEISSVKIVWSVPTSAGNEIQNKTVNVKVTFGLEQVR